MTEMNGKKKRMNESSLMMNVPNGKAANNRTRHNPRHNPFKLIPCESFASQTEAPFTVQLSVECLVIVDIHAHSLTTEVIGLLGGVYCRRTSQLYVLTAEPCLTIGDENLQCEMEPVSQALANERLESKGYHCCGWYHSHPTFVPNPSLRDLETQMHYQHLFDEKPFIALILSPYSTLNDPTAKNTLVSKFKLITIGSVRASDGEATDGTADGQCPHQCYSQRVPYELSPQLIRKEKLMFTVTNKLKELRRKIRGKPTAVVMNDKIRKFRGGEITYLQKLLASLKYYLERTGLSHVETSFLLDQCTAIIIGNE